MSLASVLFISIGASLGALIRWWLSLTMNAIFPTIPLGTLAANIIGGFLMGVFMGITRGHAFIPEAARLAVATGFLGGLTTFSTFSAETVTLISNQEYFWTCAIVIGHVAGSLLATICGIYTVKIILS